MKQGKVHHQNSSNGGKSLIFLDNLPVTKNVQREKKPRAQRNFGKNQTIAEIELEKSKMDIDSLQKTVKEQAIINIRLKKKIQDLKTLASNDKCQNDDSALKEEIEKQKHEIFVLKENLLDLKNTNRIYKEKMKENGIDIVRSKGAMKSYDDMPDKIVGNMDACLPNVHKEMKDKSTQSCREDSAEFYVRNSSNRNVSVQTENSMRQVSIQTDGQLCNDTSAQTDQIPHQDVSTQCDDGQDKCNATSPESNQNNLFESTEKSKTDFERSILEHNYTLTLPSAENIADVPFACPDCGRTLKIKYNLETHRREHCKESIEKNDKNMKCPVCDQVYTYNGLRSHLNQFTGNKKGKHIARGEHSKVSPEDHKSILDEIKNKYKQNKLI